MSGGKQYRVAPGDRVLVDRLAAEPGSEIKLGRVLLLNDGKEVRVGSATDGLDVGARVIGHPRGPRIESIRYKSKKRVRVHRGGRADLTALEILTVGGIGLEAPAPKEEAAEKAARPRRGRAKAEASQAEEPAPETQTAEAEAPKKTTRRRTKKESE